ncbi:MAG TPA: DUF2889 domain-containing protein [Acidimicrobiales bacterium]|jgi:hypothetical protein
MTDRSAFQVASDWPEPPDDSVVGTPDRVPGSVRRTATINIVWPDGWGTPMEQRGRCRDLLTPTEGEPIVLAEAGMRARVGDGRTVEEIEAWPVTRGDVSGLVGSQGGAKFRSAIDAVLPGEREAVTPLYFLLDDIAGCSLIGGFAWSRHRDGWGGPAEARQLMTAAAVGAAQRAPQEIGMRKGKIICSGLRPGGYHQATREAGVFDSHFLRVAGDLSSDDPWAWHEIEPPADVMLRRRRRVDTWLEGDLIAVDAHFRDAVWEPDGTEMALHEYTLQARVDRQSRQVTEIAAQPRVLPFPECPGAAPHVAHLVGLPVGGFRTSVQDTLRELEACTHLNDMLRCLAEVHTLATHLEGPALV